MLKEKMFFLTFWRYASLSSVIKILNTDFHNTVETQLHYFCTALVCAKETKPEIKIPLHLEKNPDFYFAGDFFPFLKYTHLHNQQILGFPSG